MACPEAQGGEEKLWGGGRVLILQIYCDQVTVSHRPEPNAIFSIYVNDRDNTSVAPHTVFFFSKFAFCDILWHPNFNLGEEITRRGMFSVPVFEAKPLVAVGLCISSLLYADLAKTKVKGQRASLGVPSLWVLTGGRCAACALVSRVRGTRGASGRGRRPRRERGVAAPPPRLKAAHSEPGRRTQRRDAGRAVG